MGRRRSYRLAAHRQRSASTSAAFGATVHDEAGEYLLSVFDVVHHNGGGTLMFIGQKKFLMHDRSWDGINGAPDITGVGNGRDKIDLWDTPGYRTAVTEADAIFGQLLAGIDANLVFAPGVDPGADLYDLNPSRFDPVTSRPGLDGPLPLGVHEIANLALDLLGYDALPGSTFNAAQDLRIG